MLKIAMLFTLAVALCLPLVIRAMMYRLKIWILTSTFYKKTDFTTPPKSAIIYWDVAQLKGDDDIDHKSEIDDKILNTTLDNLVSLYGTSTGDLDSLGIFTFSIGFTFMN